MSILSNKPIMSSTPLSNRLVVELKKYKNFVKNIFCSCSPGCPGLTCCSWQP